MKRREREKRAHAALSPITPVHVLASKSFQMLQLTFFLFWCRLADEARSKRQKGKQAHTYTPTSSIMNELCIGRLETAFGGNVKKRRAII